VLQFLSKHFTLEQQINFGKDVLLKYAKVLDNWQEMKDALNSRDHNYLDNYLKETEKKSRVHLQKLFEGHLIFD